MGSPFRRVFENTLPTSVLFFLLMLVIAMNESGLWWQPTAFPAWYYGYAMLTAGIAALLLKNFDLSPKKPYWQQVLIFSFTMSLPQFFCIFVPQSFFRGALELPQDVIKFWGLFLILVGTVAILYAVSTYIEQCK